MRDVENSPKKESTSRRAHEPEQDALCPTASFTDSIADSMRRILKLRHAMEIQLPRCLRKGEAAIHRFEANAFSPTLKQLQLPSPSWEALGEAS